MKTAILNVLGWAGTVLSVSLLDISAALLDQVVNGFERKTLMNEDLVRIGG
ncbi:hypothetical protein EJ08DRAFT_645241, partial [Tothia fuscella]